MDDFNDFLRKIVVTIKILLGNSKLLTIFGNIYVTNYILSHNDLTDFYI